MMRYSWSFVARRFGLMLLIIWSGATLNFFIPKLTPRNPLREKLLMEATRSGYIPPGFEEMVQAYEAKFGLDKPLWQQYASYMGDMLRGNLGYSISNYPKTVWELILEGLPWTIGLLLVTTLLSFLIGSLLGALMAWPRSSNFVKYILPSFLVLGAVPAYVIALTLIYFVAFRWKILPMGGGYGIGTFPSLSVSFALEVLKHSILPAVAIILASAGGWAIGMRGMMVTVQGEDYMTFGEAKGLKETRLFYKYGVRNALLPQVTGLALSLAFLVSGNVLVELVMGYPGIGTLLARSISQLDYFMIYGIVFVIIVGLAIAMFIMDMIYPLLDPRIATEGN
ncbi:MAG: ABC transporter permease [Caldilineaceae bacterium]|nr:ABC transporter permease [Caldilineaceae bacterium]